MKERRLNKSEMGYMHNKNVSQGYVSKRKILDEGTEHMIRINWTEKEVEWFHASAEYTTYNEELAQVILKYAKTGGTLCDIGCGAALVDFQLAEYFSHITCVDIGEKAIESVNHDIENLGIGNMTGICQDGETLTGQWDNVLTIFHGGADVFKRYFKYAKDRMIIITHNKTSKRFGEREKHNYHYNSGGTKEELDAMGIPYEYEEVELEHGQPFTSMEDAIDFFRHHVTFETEEEAREYLEKHLQETGDEKYPYYQPKKKKFCVFVIRKEENEERR